MLLLSSGDLFSKLMFSNNYFGNSISVKQFDPGQGRHLSGLIWFKTVCKGYQKTTKVAVNKNRVTISV